MSLLRPLRRVSAVLPLRHRPILQLGKHSGWRSYTDPEHDGNEKKPPQPSRSRQKS